MLTDDLAAEMNKNMTRSRDFAILDVFEFGEFLDWLILFSGLFLGFCRFKLLIDVFKLLICRQNFRELMLKL